MCSCGNCECYPSPTNVQLYSGSYCECDNTRCPFFTGEPCGGAMRGTCLCNGTCECTGSYEHGDVNPVRRCECPKLDTEEAKRNCIATPGEEYCSSHGKCQCGRCICDRGPDGSLESPLYEGRFCEVCSICQSACSTIGTCVQCLLARNQECEMCRDMACGTDQDCRASYAIPTLEVLEDSIPSDANVSSFVLLRDNPLNRLCAVMLSECVWDVLLPANLTGMESGIKFYANLRVCPAFIEWWYFLVAAIGVTVAVGVVVLVVTRLIYKYIERRQFNRWNREVQSVPFQMGKSPLYVSPEEEFKNPAYKQKKGVDAVKNPIYQKKTHEPLVETEVEL